MFREVPAKEGLLPDAAANTVLKQPVPVPVCGTFAVPDTPASWTAVLRLGGVLYQASPDPTELRV